VAQGHVASDHGWLVILSRPGRSGGDEPGVEAIRGCVHKQRALNTRLSSGTSAGTFACPAGPYRNWRGEEGPKNEPKWYFVPVQKKGSESWSSRFEPKISLISFSRGSRPPFNYQVISEHGPWKCNNKPGLNSGKKVKILSHLNKCQEKNIGDSLYNAPESKAWSPEKVWLG